MKSNKFLYFLIGVAFLGASCDTQSNAESAEAEFLTTDDTKILSELKVEEKWELPAILKEVSGIVYLDQDRFACVQDELGTIFIFNTNTSKIEKEIPFAEAGDYEGIAINGDMAYIARSDGQIFEVKGWNSDNPQTSTYKTFLTEDNNVESLCFDQKNNRLLLAIKGTETGNKDYKGIYSFNLQDKKLQKDPVFKIDLNHSVFKGIKEKKRSKIVQPSEINIHPTTGDIYITDAKNPKIIVMDSAGKLKSLYQIDKSNFPQAEGIAFSPSGDLFISNEGKDENATILKVNIK